MVAGSTIIYRINERDEIVYTNEAWDRFAVENSGEAITSDRIQHRLLWDFIGDSTTRELYRQILKRIREGHVFRFKFRCDSPSCRRFMEMDVVPGEGGTIEFRTQTLLQEFRPHEPLLDSTIPRTEALIRVCGWCKKVHQGISWVEVEKAVSDMRLFERPLLPQMTHGICESCFEELTRTLKK